MNESSIPHEITEFKESIIVNTLLSELISLDIVLHPRIQAPSIEESCEKLRRIMQEGADREIMLTNDYQAGVRLIGDNKNGYQLVFVNLLADLSTARAPWLGLFRSLKERKLIKLIKTHQRKFAT